MLPDNVREVREAKEAATLEVVALVLSSHADHRVLDLLHHDAEDHHIDLLRVATLTHTYQKGPAALVGVGTAVAAPRAVLYPSLDPDRHDGRIEDIAQYRADPGRHRESSEELNLLEGKDQRSQ